MAVANNAHDLVDTKSRVTEPKNAKPNSITDVSIDQLYVQPKVEQNLFNLSAGGNLSFNDVEAVDVQVRNLTVAVDTGPSWSDVSTYPELMAARFNVTPRVKTLLHPVSANLQSASLTAIIGGSGSGKTTLLNTLAERVVSSRLNMQGLATFNGQVGVNSIRHAYVMQQDVLLPTLTVRETLRYSADLRLPSSTKAEDREKIVEEVIRELGLKECADTRIGNSQHRGCSGGEKRRVTIGVQLLSNPSVLFLDEPTTGLDATSAFQLIQTLKRLAQKGRTIITTIHQPRSEIWDLFDNLIVLSKGNLVYSGTISECLPWFENLGFQLPPFVNPAEFVIDTTAVDNRTPELEAITNARLEALLQSWEIESGNRFPPLEGIFDIDRSRTGIVTKHAGFWRQLHILTRRALKVTYRDPLGMSTLLIQSVVVGVVIGYLFFDLGRDQAGIRSRQGALYIAASFQGYLILIYEVFRLTLDMPIFDRENSEHCVDALPYVLSRRLARLPTEDLPGPLLFSLIFYFMVGFDRTAEKFFTFFAITLLNHYACIMCAFVCVVAVRHFPGASLIANLAFTLQSIASGIFIQSNSIPVYVRWLKWLTWTFYSFGSYSGNEFQGNFYDCPNPAGLSDPSCTAYSGDYIIASLGFPTNWIARPIIALMSFSIFFFALSVIGLHFFKVEMTISRSRTSDTDLSAGKEKMTAHSISEIRAIDIDLEKFALDLDKRAINGKRFPRKTILQPVNATFKAGTLNVIMGPSGSGKSSLLNSIALRLRNSLGTKYLPSGKLTFNGAVPSASVIRSVCSYVCQDDDGLLPSLTVRETLRFSAALRLPSFMTQEEKFKRAEDILIKMGLKDCADNLIGNDLIKGISGGEKRRVSIAIQVLTNPRILLLDEPTSGLDAFTANSIMEVLQGLAHEGRTLIFTIHQPRSDLFKHFGNILLLARGGAPAYAGPAKELLGYLSSRGYRCPQHANPADFALDIITVDLQRDDKEAASRGRVTELIEHWRHLSYMGEAEPWKIVEVDDRTVDASADQLGTKDESSEGSLPAKYPQAAAAETAHTPLDKVTLSTPAELGALIRDGTALSTAVPLLLHRAIINTRRQPDLIMARTMQVVSLAIIFTLFFAPLRNDYYAVQTRMGFLQQVGAFYSIGMLQNVAVYPNERDVFYREHDDGVYGVNAFLASYTILEITFEIIGSLIYGVFICIAVGLPRTAVMYFISVFACFGVVSCGESLGIIFNTLFSHTGFAVSIMSMFLSMALVMAGVLSINMPKAFKALNYLSPIRYAVNAVAPYSLRGVKFYCTAEQKLADGSCPITTGEQVLQLYKFEEDPLVNVAALAGCIVVYRLLAWALVKAARARWGDIYSHKREK